MSNVDVEMRVSVIVDINVELNCEKLFRQVVIFAWNKGKNAKSFFFCPRSGLQCHGFAGSIHSDSMSQVLSTF